jgi:hypothetical protein
VALQAIECTICYQNVDDQGKSCPGCKYTFHTGCLTTWVQQDLASHGTCGCPYCRTSLAGLNLIQDIPSQMNAFTLEQNLLEQVKKGDSSLLEELVRTKQINQISADQLNVCLFHASMNGYLNVINGLIESGRFAEISIEELKLCLLIASKNGRSDIIEVLRKNERFQEIPEAMMNFSVKCAAEAGHTQTANMLKSNRFKAQTLKTLLKLSCTLAILGSMYFKPEIIGDLLSINQFHPT